MVAESTAQPPARWLNAFVVDPDSGCHVWAKARQSRGYGVFWFQGRVHLAHRVAWFLSTGSWPSAEFVIDHACSNKACVNADHLREYPNSLNIRRAYARGDEATEHRRAGWRAANARRRAYSPTYRVGGD